MDACAHLVPIELGGLALVLLHQVLLLDLLNILDLTGADFELLWVILFVRGRVITIVLLGGFLLLLESLLLFGLLLFLRLQFLGLLL